MFRKKFLFYLTAIVLFLSIIFFTACQIGNIVLPTRKYVKASIDFAPDLSNPCAYQMLSNYNIESVEISVYTFNNKLEPIDWEEGAFQEPKVNNGEIQIKIPEEGLFGITARVKGKCLNCCNNKCDNQKGKPIFIGTQKEHGGIRFITIPIKFRKCQCCKYL